MSTTSKDAMGRLILEAGTGMHGDAAKQLAEAWCAIAAELEAAPADAPAMYSVPAVVGEIRHSDKFGEYAFLSKTARVVVGDKLITERDHLSVIAALQARIAKLEARQVPEWVSVADHLPPKNTEVLICFAGQNTLVSTGQWTGSIHDVNGWCYPHENRGGTDNGDDPVVTHWQYAPEVPATQPPEGR